MGVDVGDTIEESAANASPSRGNDGTGGAVARRRSRPRKDVLRLTSTPREFFGRTPGLDGIRAVAVLTVILFHTSVLRFFQTPWLPGGHAGVDLFFVLSGFLITSLLLRELADNGHIRLLAFWGRRVLRLYPALVVVLAASTLYVSVRHENMGAQLTSVASGAFYVANWRAIWGWAGNSDLGHLWSLSIEEQFYIFWPPVLILLIALKTRVSVVVTMLVAAIALVVVHRQMLIQSKYPDLFMELRTDCKVDTLLIGCLAAILWTYGFLPYRRHLTNAAATIALIYIVWDVRNVDPTIHSYEVWRILFPVSGVAVILALIGGTWFARWFFELRPMRAIGRVSYGLYLWHLPVFLIMLRIQPRWNSNVTILVALSIAVAGTLASWFLVEKNALRLKQRLEPARPPKPTSVPTPAGAVG
jgi:peptidoglycan/LPS O-acetylase OafA/YrhL